jgi:hypothetical protein
MKTKMRPSVLTLFALSLSTLCCGQGVSPAAPPDDTTTAALSTGLTCSAPYGTVFLDGDPTEYVHPGAQVLADGTWQLGDQAPNDVIVEYHNSDYSEFWTVWISTRALGTNLAPGTYLNAQRAAFASPGHPGLDVYGDGRGCNTVTGQFKVDKVTFDASGLVELLASFHDHCEGLSPDLEGMIAYHR